jgi:hypothetical protein
MNWFLLAGAVIVAFTFGFAVGTVWGDEFLYRIESGSEKKK